MKLLVILLCLLSERYVVHAASYLRFNWFTDYCNKIYQISPQTKVFSNPAVILALIVLPLVILCALVLLLIDHWLFGIICFLLNLAIFYYCLGPDNPFYPIREKVDEPDPELASGRYFAQVNGQLFAVLFWYVVAGPLAAVVYRLISLCREQELTAKLAEKITSILDWIPARISVLLYLLVGNFQKGYGFFVQRFFSLPENNDSFLSEGGLLAARINESEPVLLPYAENLVEHAVIVYLVLLAFFTLVALV
ncbi:regulatory protein AmpE [Legionella massiliensis]|uniref:Regulatory protein AmpE n=1 Tax=Legionella massiliensis TaxID=1034943 RepID=A0A078L1L3_9GAMM|nr:membrane protein [Legionella massiliensis]CDZ79142.1 regulatory protein AmpE [Legionella massiliensis]CEE14880.1 regulatory protein AmpE [Legionella massiliensis]